MRAVADDYRTRLGVLDVENRVAPDDEKVAFISSVTSQPKTSGFSAEYWIANFVSPIRFSDAVQALTKARHQPSQQAFFIEIGPCPALSGPVRQFLQHVITDGNTEGVTDYTSCTVTARLISLDAGSIDARQGSTLALGLDSLVAVELRNWVMRQFDAPLQPTEILANQTVQTLVEKIAARSKKVVSVAA